MLYTKEYTWEEEGGCSNVTQTGDSERSMRWDIEDNVDNGNSKQSTDICASFKVTRMLDFGSRTAVRVRAVVILQALILVLFEWTVPAARAVYTEGSLIAVAWAAIKELHKQMNDRLVVTTTFYTSK